MAVAEDSADPVATNRLRVFVLIFVVALGWFYLREREPDTAAQSPTARASGANKSRSTPSTVQTESPPSPPTLTTTKIREPVAEPARENPNWLEKRDPLQPPKPPRGTVAFKVEKDLVIAFGDVLLGKPTRENFPNKGFIPVTRPDRWKGVEIAYAIHQDLPNPDRVLRVIDYFNQNTPIRFVPLANQSDSIVFAPTDLELCLSYVGRVGGHQPIYLDDRCGEGEIIHEVMHALGFIHEHSRPERDSYVRVNWQNIEADKRDQFDIAPDVFGDPQKGRPFDYQSVMIYRPGAFAAQPGSITLEAPQGLKIEPTTSGLSAEDLNRLDLWYGKLR